MNDTLLYTSRHLADILPLEGSHQLLLLTGARQTGKTTLVRHCYPELSYFNLDAPEIRDLLRATPTTSWHSTVKEAILDEIQKLPELFEKVKYSFDEGTINFSVLTGSSQILLLKKVSESLAGRVAIYELFPLMFSELYAQQGERPSLPLLDHLIQADHIDNVLNKLAAVILDDSAARLKAAQEHLSRWGGMPALLHLHFDEERFKWLRDYEYTYLQCDLADLARLNDLEPFRRFQKLSALRVSNLINFSELATDAGISVDTARRYLEYLKISYQAILLQPYYKNLTNTVIKTPKLYWLDMGILRSLTGIRDGMTGDLFENLVISEIIKWIRTMQRDVELYFYRTQSGAEVDLLIKTAKGIIGVEIKLSSSISTKHTKTLKDIASVLDKQWLGGMVIYNGDIIKMCSPGIWYVPVWRLF